MYLRAPLCSSVLLRAPLRSSVLLCDQQHSSSMKLLHTANAAVVNYSPQPVLFSVAMKRYNLNSSIISKQQQ